MPGGSATTTMQSLVHAITSPAAVGTEIPIPWPSLQRLVTLRTSEILVIGAAPGGGKSTVAVALAIESGQHVLYLAQDGPASIVARMLAYQLNIPIHQAYDMMLDDRGQMSLSHRLGNITDHIIIERGAVTVEGITERVEAATEWIGHPPPIVVVDNLIDLKVEGSNHAEMGFYSRALTDLKQLANSLDILVVALHHVTRGGDDDHGLGQSPITLKDLLFAGEREARHVWGVYNNGRNRITIQVLKQTDGSANPHGTLRTSLEWKQETGRIWSSG